MEHERIILGGGITGLVISYYTNIPVLCDINNVGGQLSMKSWDLGPKFVQVDEATTKLLKDLNLPLDTKMLDIGYMVDGELTVKDDLFRQLYYQKTRNTKKDFIKSSMSGGKNQIESFTVDTKDIIDKLKTSLLKNGLLIPYNAVSIDTNKRIIDCGETGGKHKYHELISTIPAPIFKKIAIPEINNKFECLNKTFVLVDEPADFDYDYVYEAGTLPHHRITKYKNQSIYEYVGKEPGTLPKEIDRCCMWIGQIQNQEKSLKIDGVVFVGRYAEWRHNFLINDSIRAALKIKEMM